MDLLFSKYASPSEFIRLYIEQGRFGEFVLKILETDYKQKIEIAEKENEDKIWDLYVHSMRDKSFYDFRKDILHPRNEQRDNYEMTDEQVSETVNKSRGILKNSKMK